MIRPLPVPCSMVMTLTCFRPLAKPNQCSANVTKFASFSTKTGTSNFGVSIAPNSTLRLWNTGLQKTVPEEQSTYPGSPTPTPLTRVSSILALRTQARTALATKSANCEAVNSRGSQEIVSDVSTLPVKSVIDTTI